MITFSKLGKKGNLGNQLFQIASTVSLAEKYGHNYFFPKWDYSGYFKNNFSVFEKDESFEIIKEKSFSFYQWDLGKNNYDLDGWLQSEKYFNNESVRKIFEFGDFSEQLLLDYHFLFTKKTILVSIRRGDFVRHPYYFQLSHLYYFKAITFNFPDWQECNIIFTSDNISYCKKHFSFVKNSFFLENLTAVEQLVLGSKCDHFVISNSTFSWWIAWLGEKQNSIIVRPIKNFRGKYAEDNNDSDYFPERWISFDDKIHKIEWKYPLFLLRGFITEIASDIRSFYRMSKKEIKKKIKSVLFIK
jgi:hypothetical protein